MNKHNEVICATCGLLHVPMSFTPQQIADNHYKFFSGTEDGHSVRVVQIERTIIYQIPKES